VDKLHYLSPTLSNNHINDFGNDGVQLIHNILLNNNFNSFGVGKHGDIKIRDNTADNLINMALHFEILISLVAYYLLLIKYMALAI
ncbi:hypothetical protein ACVUN4_004801, partial [Escherichia coli]